MTERVDIGDTVTLYLGDCLQVLPTLADGSVDAVITDPPYFLPPPAHATKGGIEWAGQLGELVMFEHSFTSFFDEFKRVLNLTGQLYLCCHDRSYPCFYRLAYTRWPKVALIVWYKPTGRVGGGWRRSHELIMHCAYHTSKYAPGFRQDVVGIMPVRTLNRKHPAEKPGDLIEFLLEAVPANVTVLDPFMGSGGTGVACVRTGRHFIGIEIDPTYFAIAQKRIAEAQAQPRLMEAA